MLNWRKLNDKLKQMLKLRDRRPRRQRLKRLPLWRKLSARLKRSKQPRRRWLSMRLELLKKKKELELLL